MLDDYAKANDVLIETEAFPYASLYETLNINLTQATGVYDVVSMDDPWMPLLAGFQLLMSLDELMDGAGIERDDDFVPQLYALGEYPPGTGQRGIPWIGNVQVFAYRTDVLQGLGLPVPATWDDVVANARAITEGRQRDGLYGFGLRGQPGNHVTTSFLPVLRGYGVDIFQSNEIFEPQLATEQAAAAIETFLTLAALSPPDVQNVGHDENGRNLYTGRTAQSADIWPDHLQLANDPDQSSVVGLVAVGAEPAQAGAQPANMTGNWLLGIPVGSKNAELAFDFILWLTAPEQQKRLLLDQNIAATRTSVYEDPEAIARLPYLPGMLAAARSAVPRPRTEFYPAVEEILGGYLVGALTGQISGQDALARANLEIRARMVAEGLLDG